MTTYCNWCGSSATHFRGYQCWEEDERGNTIIVDSLDTDYTPRTALYWCEECNGESAYNVDGSIDVLPDHIIDYINTHADIATAQTPWLSPQQDPATRLQPPPTGETSAPHHDTPDPPSDGNPAST